MFGGELGGNPINIKPYLMAKGYNVLFGEEIETLTFIREPTPGYVKYVKPQ